MTQYGLPRARRRREARRRRFAPAQHDVSATSQLPPLVTVDAHQKVGDAVSLLHEHGVSQLPVVSSRDARTVVGSIGERGLLKHAVGDPSCWRARIADVMEPPFAAVTSPIPSARPSSCSRASGRRCWSPRTAGRRGSSRATDLLEALAR